MAQIRKRKRIPWLLPPIAAAGIVTAGLSLLIAYLMRSGLIPEHMERAAMLLSLSLGAAAAGAMTDGAGKRGLLVGAGIAILWSTWRLCTASELFFHVSTLAEIALCILISWLSSCTFHKNQKNNTNRNHRK